MYKSKLLIGLNDIKGCVVVEYDVSLPPNVMEYVHHISKMHYKARSED
jgi:hypothetical protein